MIHIFIGTKAQYVKTAPIIKEFDQRGITYNLIDSGQHAAISKQYRSYFQVREPDYFLRQADTDIKSVWMLLVWLSQFFVQLLFTPKKMFQNLFQGQKGICLIHGDTPTTFLSALAAKRFGIKVVHLESGLRSYNLFHPFPEEIIRIITMRLSDYLFAPNEWSMDNLKKMKQEAKAFLVCGNTNIDALRLSKTLTHPLPEGLSKERPFVIFSIHRVETILNKNRLKQVVDLVEHIAKDYDVLFCMHPPTQKQLHKYRLDQRLMQMEHVHIRNLLPYPEFIQAIKQACFIVTDGGSIQEESFFLNIPCLVMRHHTERIEGLNANVCLCAFDAQKIEYFLNNVERFRISSYKDRGEEPSKEIVDIILKQIQSA